MSNNIKKNLKIKKIIKKSYEKMIKSNYKMDKKHTKYIGK